MLVLVRRVEESIVIDGRIRIKVLSIRGDRVRLGVDAPRDVAVHREEIQEVIDGESRHGKESS